jgi:hypothetical protein
MKRKIRLLICCCVAIAGLIVGGSFWSRSRMANNQTEAAKACIAFAQAQEIYRRNDHDGDDVLEYSQSLRELAEHGFILPEFAAAELDGPSITPYNGYVFRVLKSQGKNATGGAKDYVVDGNMTGGYALLASPYVYDRTARDTFVISYNGTIFQKDLGPEITTKRATVMFDPAEIGPWG